MGKYRVTVQYTMTGDLAIYASDEERAKERAEEIVLAWKDVEHAEATEAEEEDA